MKAATNMISGFLGSVISYAAVLFTGISVIHLIGLSGTASAALDLGMSYLIYNVFAGMLGGYVGGNNRGFNGALVGGVIMGAVAAILRILYVFYA
jgi:hypothetical protein